MDGREVRKGGREVERERGESIRMDEYRESSLILPGGSYLLLWTMLLVSSLPSAVQLEQRNSLLCAAAALLGALCAE